MANPLKASSQNLFVTVCKSCKIPAQMGGILFRTLFSYRAPSYNVDHLCCFISLPPLLFHSITTFAVSFHYHLCCSIPLSPLLSHSITTFAVLFHYHLCCSIPLPPLLFHSISCALLSTYLTVYCIVYVQYLSSYLYNFLISAFCRSAFLSSGLVNPQAFFNNKEKWMNHKRP